VIMKANILSNLKKIAILRANALGDFIFALPALKALRETYPKAELVYLGKPWHETFLKDRKEIVDRVVTIPVSYGIREENGKRENTKELESFFCGMQKKKFDIAIQLHGGGRNSNPFVSKLGAQITIGSQTFDALGLDTTIPYIYYQNEYLRCLEIVALVGAKTKEIVPHLNVRPKDVNEAREVIGGMSKPLVILHPGVNDLRRQWPEERFAQVGDSLAKKGLSIALTGTKNEEKLVSNVIRKMQIKPLNLCSKLTINGLTGLLKIAKLIISNDTGPLHLGAAIGTKTVGIYWCGNRINGGPITIATNTPLISWLTRCPLCGTDMTKLIVKKSHECSHNVSFVKDVSVKTVYEAANYLLAEE
jgi:ADP-heptose:LPS heptosyltransferase